MYLKPGRLAPPTEGDMQLLPYLSDGCNGAVQLGQVLMQLLYLQVQRLGFQLADLLNLGEGGRGNRRGEGGWEKGKERDSFIG